MKWGILLGSPAISGGTYVIFEHALRALKQGEEVTMITEVKVNPSELYWHEESENLEWKTYQEVADRRFDVLIATWWRTVYEAYRIHSKHYVYFVQSIESKFYDPQELPIMQLVDATYLLPFTFITEATWIKKHLLDYYNKNACLIHNGIRKDIYKADGNCIAPREPGKLRILVEGPLLVGYKNIPKTIQLCRQSKGDEIWLMTSSDIKTYEGVDRVFSRVPIFKTPEIYRSCDVLVKLSYVEGMFGPPLEMFHCGGTAITYDVTGYDEYIVHDYNGLVAKTDDDDCIISYINRLKEDPECLERLKKGARQTASEWDSWEVSSGKFRDAICKIAEQEEESLKVLEDESKFHFKSYVIAEDYWNELKSMRETKKHKQLMYKARRKIPEKWKEQLKQNRLIRKVWEKCFYKQ